MLDSAEQNLPRHPDRTAVSDLPAPNDTLSGESRTIVTTASAPIAPFMIPSEGHTYIEQVRSRCRDLIDCGIWSGLHIQRLNQWWSNFRNDSERYFAACLLDSITYRSEDQTIALMRQLVQRVLPDHGRASGGIVDWQERLRPASSDPGVRLVPVVPFGSAPGKSADVILRLFARKLHVPRRVFANPEDIASLVAGGMEAIVFVDDLLGTGTQFVKDFAIPYGLGNLGTNTRLIYAPLVAHDDGVAHIHSNLPNVSVASAETLGPSHAIFGAGGRTFKDGLNSPQSAWSLYLNILSTRGIVLGSSIHRGFGALELAFFFEHAAPNNCLPIFWWNQPAKWKSLFDR